MKQEVIELEFLDHVGIRVNDLKESVEWYANVFGLKKYKLEKWGDFPIFMMSKKFGIALFPAKLDDGNLNTNYSGQKIDHFAFNVNKVNFEKAKKRYAKLELTFEVKDHYYFDSIYTKDPNGITVELTTLKVSEDDFYKVA